MRIPLLLCLFLTGCMTTKQMDALMSSWMGAHMTALIAKWGPPDLVFSDGSGGQVFVYDESGHVNTMGMSTTTATGGPGYAYATTLHQPASTIHIPRSRTFFVGTNGVIYRTDWKGL